MFTLPLSATDDELRGGVFEWLRAVAAGTLADAKEILHSDGLTGSMSIDDFLSRVCELSSNGCVTMPDPNHTSTLESELDDPVSIVCRWIPGPETTEKHPGFVADILHSIPVDGKWSELDASFFVRVERGRLSLELRDVIRYSDA